MSQLEQFNYVAQRIQDEGLHYCFKHYSEFEEIEDPEFHKLREEYLLAAEKLENYVEEKENSYLMGEDLDFDDESLQ
jgi:hypothetical protein